MRYIIFARGLFLGSSPLLFKRLSIIESLVGPVEMWESRAAFGRGFSKRRWKSALFADSHGRGISIRPFAMSFHPQILLKIQIF